MELSYKIILLLNMLPFGFITQSSVIIIIPSASMRQKVLCNFLNAHIIKEATSVDSDTHMQTIKYYCLTPAGYTYLLNTMSANSLYARTAERCESIVIRHGIKRPRFNRLLKMSEAMTLFYKAEVPSSFLYGFLNYIAPALYAKAKENEDAEDSKELFYQKGLIYMSEINTNLRNISISNKNIKVIDLTNECIFYPAIDVGQLLRVSKADAKNHSYFETPGLFINRSSAYIVRSPLLSSTSWDEKSIKKLGCKLSVAITYSAGIAGIKNLKDGIVSEVITLVRDYAIDAYEKLQQNINRKKDLKGHWKYGLGCYRHYFISTTSDDVYFLRAIKDFGEQANAVLLAKWVESIGEIYKVKPSLNAYTCSTGGSLFIAGFIPETHSLNYIWDAVEKADETGLSIVIVCSKNQKQFYSKLFPSAKIVAVDVSAYFD